MVKSLLSISLITIYLLLSQANAAGTVEWQIDNCRITTTDAGDFLSCEQKGPCASQTTGSNVNCSTYTYKPITQMADCISTCCWQLSPVPTNLTPSLIQQCYDQAQHRFKIYVIQIVFIVLAVAFVVAFIIAICVCGFVKNPYTGKRVWVGCCCCKRVPNFEEDRKQLQSQGSAIKKQQIEQDKPGSIFQPRSNIKDSARKSRIH